jgi:cysteinyl-tRNA synthetase
LPLKVYNTLSRKLEDFVPLDPNHIRMYVCGPTVYGHSHIGHAKSYVSFDVIFRYLKYAYPNAKVTYVQNITDVGHLANNSEDGDDPILREARKVQQDPMEIAQFYTRSFQEDMKALGNLPPNIAPTASGHITEQIEIIKTLIEKGNAYESNGSVYFDVTSFAAYGKLSGRLNQDELESGKRIDVKTEKRHASDFALWKKADPTHLMKWPSPWSVGYPGWHIECSAMSMKYLGESFDIHGGGLENQFPHHECEIAQSEAATGKPFVKYWLHNNMVTVNGTKMGKSLGNFTTIKDALKKFDPMAIRFFILQSHYRSPLDFSDDAITAAGRGYTDLMNFVSTLSQPSPSLPKSSSNAPSESDFEERFINDVALAEENFRLAMDNDFNTPQAISALFTLRNNLRHGYSTGEGREKAARFFKTALHDVLGLSETSTATSEDASEKIFEVILTLRKEAKAKKDFTTSDKIRDQLKAIGYAIEDNKDGTSIVKKI